MILKFEMKTHATSQYCEIKELRSNHQCPGHCCASLVLACRQRVPHYLLSNVPSVTALKAPFCYSNSGTRIAKLEIKPPLPNLMMRPHQ